MKRAFSVIFWIVLLVVCPVSATETVEKKKKALDHNAYDIWSKISGQAISKDGSWVLYSLKPGKGDGVLKVWSNETREALGIDRGVGARFSDDSRFVIARVVPEEKVLEEFRKKNKKKGKGKDGEPKAGLAILDLATKERVRIDRVKSFKLPAKAGGWVAYLMEREEEKKEEKDNVEAEGGEKKEEEEEEKKVEETKEKKEKSKKKKPEEIGTQLVLRNLDTGAEIRYQNVKDYLFTEDGSRLFFATSSEQVEEDGVFSVETATGKLECLLSGRGTYKSLVSDEAGSHFSFLTDRDDVGRKDPSWAVYRWSAGMKKAIVAAMTGTDGIPQGWGVSQHRAPTFSRKGERLFFGTTPLPEEKSDLEEGEETSTEEKEGEELKEEKGDPDEAEEKIEVKVDIWHWQDPQLQPQQLVQLEREKKRSYLAVLHLAEPTKVVQLATVEVPSVTVGSRGDGEVAVGISNRPYRKEVSWDWPGYNDIYLLDAKTGSRELVLSRIQGSASLSPLSKYLTWWDSGKRAWFSLGVKSRKTVNLTELLPHSVSNELHDLPAVPRSYGSAGWVKDDLGFLVYDRYDVWLTNPSGFWPPVCLTDGEGRKNQVRYRYVKLDSEQDAVDPAESMLLSVFNEKTKASGFSRDRVRSTEPPQSVVLGDERFSTPRKAKDMDRVLFSRSTYEKFPDLWVSDLSFTSMVQVSDANPQQADYQWGSAELVDWMTLDGNVLQGFLCKPDGFDPAKKYPMMVYFYERNSDNLHQHVAPEPFRSIINRTFYCSRGYLVFVPDIPYKIGFPGQSAVNAVTPGVTALVQRGFVDPERIGVQGHSWGGYQIAYMVTKTNIFAAAEAGAPVSNMTSAYGGIRWGSGMSRMFQYEKTQSRIGGTLWDAFHRYVENSPVFWADNVETPLLMMHNDQDGAVPWYQGIELFVALRRLGKPAWLINYNGEPHNLLKMENKKDWAVRMQQFFDHYLKDAPAPEWLVNGIPAMKKGKTLGLENADTPPLK